MDNDKNKQNHDTGGKGKPSQDGGKGNKQTDDDWKEQATCHHCKKKGHINLDCPELKKDKQVESDPKNEQ